MSKLIVSEFVTLDGVIEAPGGEPTHAHTGWVEPFFSPDLGEFKGHEVFDAERLLLGRTTYESFAGAWPDYEGEMAVKMNTMPKHVVTSSTEPLEWEGAQRLAGDLVPAVRELVATSTGDVLVAGSCQLVHTLLRADLVDELRLQLFPISIGGGRLRLFPDGGALLRYALVESRPFESGALLLRYRRG